MSTIDKCCQTVKDFHNVLNQIKLERQRNLQKQQNNSKSFSQSDRKKILKLFSYDKWGNYMKWIDEKLEESGEDLQSFIDISRGGTSSQSQIRMNENNEDSEDRLTIKKQGKYEQSQSFSLQNETEYDLLEKQNRKLKKQHVHLRKQYDDLKRTYSNIMK